MQQTGEDEMASPRLPTCRFYRYKYSRGEHYEHDLEESEEYFFLLVTTTDPGSFVVVSSVTSPALRLLPSSPSSAASSPSLHEHRVTSSLTTDGSVSSGAEPPSPWASDTDDEEGNGIVGGEGVSPSPTPELARANDNQPPAETRVAVRPVRERAAVNASPLVAATAPAGSFSKCLSCLSTLRILTSDLVALGPRLHTLDMFKIDRERWYEARSSGNVQAVIGILAGEKVLSEETRKRPRLD